MWPWHSCEAETAYEIYRFSRAVCGVSGSSFLLNGTFKTSLEYFQECGPGIVHSTIDSLYVDDLGV